MEPYGESPHHAQPARPCAALYALRPHGPSQRQFRRNKLGALFFQKLDESAKRARRFRKLGPQRSPDRDVLRQGVAHAVHWTPPVIGQGPATARNASKDTCAYTAVVFRDRCLSTSEISVSVAPLRIICVARPWRNRCAAPRPERRTPARTSAARTMWPTAAGPARPP